MQIRQIQPSEWPEFQRIRLEALKNDPRSFGASYEEEAHLDQTAWEKRLTSPSICQLGAFIENGCVGICGISYGTRLKTAHIATLMSVYVTPSSRGQGIGNKMLEESLTLIRNNPLSRKVQLHVTVDQIAAVRMYEKAGFKTIGILKEELLQNDGYSDTAVMEYYLQ